METKKITGFFLLCTLCLSAAALPPKRMFVPHMAHPRTSVLRFQGTISAGQMFGFKAQHIMLHGDVEYFINERISARSDIYYSLAVKNNDSVPPFKFNHQLMSGIQFHFTPHKPIDFYVGFQPGFALCKRRYEQFDVNGVPPSLPAVSSNVNPILSLNTGITYFGNRFFNAFLNLRYITGYHQDNYTTASINELRVSFGLGFYFHTKKKFRQDSRKDDA